MNLERYIQIYDNVLEPEAISSLIKWCNQQNFKEATVGNNQENKKIRDAKEIIISKMTEPPSLIELSSQVDISVKNLKEGFKQVYGNTVFGYLFEHKMNVASQMLTSKNHNVNEVALHLGYSTSSHFINAFKKKFGTTPKKYLNSN